MTRHKGKSNSELDQYLITEFLQEWQWVTFTSQEMYSRSHPNQFVSFDEVITK
jgi:hypothetical protein